VVEDEELLLALLNSAPVVDETPTDELSGASGAEFARRLGGTGTAREMVQLRQTRASLQTVVREGPGAITATDDLSTVLQSATRIPQLTPAGVRWELRAPADELLSVRAVLAWSDVVEQLPGRLRACANDECNLFLVDHSRPGAAKWCSMAACGNRMKARAHAARARTDAKAGA
jgi:predicted RNA-binding Zn ribbon-like protein